MNQTLCFERNYQSADVNGDEQSGFIIKIPPYVQNSFFFSDKFTILGNLAHVWFIFVIWAQIRD